MTSRIIASILFLFCISLFAVDETTDVIYDYFQVGQIPAMIDTGAVCYPDSAFKERCEGAVLVDVVIDVDGKVIDAVVAEAEPKGVFDAIALDAALNSRFEPIEFEGEPIKVRYRIPYLFDRSQYNLKRCSKVKKK